MSDLDAIRARRAAISPGRWYEDADETGQDYIYLGTDGGRLYVGDMSETTRQEHADAAFIAAAPADIDALLARVTDLETKQMHLRAALQHACDVIEGYQTDIRDSAWTGVNLQECGFCQGTIYRHALDDIKRTAGLDTP